MSYDLRITMVLRARDEQEAEKFFMFMAQQAQDLCDTSPEFEWVACSATQEKPTFPHQTPAEHK